MSFFVFLGISDYFWEMDISCEYGVKKSVQLLDDNGDMRTVVSVIILIFNLCVSGASLKHRLDQEFYEHELKGNTDAEQKIQCIDSLIKLRPERKSELLFNKARMLKELGRFEDGIRILEVLREKVAESNPSEYLKITDEYAENLFLASRMSEAYTVSRKILSYDKPA